MKLLLTHPVGSQFVRQALRAFEDAGLLAEYWTSIARVPESSWDAFLPQSLRVELRRRSYEEDILSKTRRYPVLEAARLTASRAGWRSLVRHETGRFSTDAVIRGLDARVAKRLRRGGIDAVYAYEDGAFDSFLAARDCGAERIYELPIGHWRLGRRLFKEEAELNPEWAGTLEGLQDSDEKLARKDEELRLAGTIVVPSQFVADSIVECPGVSARVNVVNYGCPAPAEIRAGPRNGPLKVLFVGSLGARKGVPYLLEAVRGLSVELTLIGPKPGMPCPPLESGLREHRYLGSVPRPRVLEEMRAHDVFVFPTLFEGLANVLMEALSQGLVPITTPNSGAGGIIRDGVNGYVVPIRSSEAVRGALEELSRDHDRLIDMRRQALATAEANSWDRYRRLLVEVVSPVGVVHQ